MKFDLSKKFFTNQTILLFSTVLDFPLSMFSGRHKTECTTAGGNIKKVYLGYLGKEPLMRISSKFRRHFRWIVIGNMFHMRLEIKFFKVTVATS